MRKYMYLALILVLSALLVKGYKIYNDAQKYKGLYDKEKQNVEAYENLNSSLNEDIKEFQLTIDELRNSKDSINRELASQIEARKIKDKTVQSIQYTTSIASKTDTIVLTDTIFKRPVDVDTIVGDEWYNLKLGLKYPSTIITQPTFKSEKYVVIHTKKEYNKKPSKIFFIRWFQKKHTSVVVDVEEKNPYIENGENRFIKIIKN